MTTNPVFTALVDQFRAYADDHNLNLAEVELELGVVHSWRFRKVANLYPRTVAIAYNFDIASALAETDEQVATKVAERERAQGREPTDWPAIGRTEGRDER